MDIFWNYTIEDKINVFDLSISSIYHSSSMSLSID